MKNTDIKIGGKWQDKDGNLCEIVDTGIYENSKDAKLMYEFQVVDYIDGDGIIHIGTKNDFLKIFKPYEPVYKYQYVWKHASRIFFDAITSHLTDKEAAGLIAAFPLKCYQKIEASKIEV